MTNFFAPKSLRIFGHRGAAGLAPENTLPSFHLAAALGANYLELDVHGTRDGEIVVFHDPTLERTTNGQGPLSDLTFSELQRLDAGHEFTTDGRHFPYRGQDVRIPTLRAVLEQFPAHRFNIEIKQSEPAIIDETIALLDATNSINRTLLAAEHDVIMKEIRRVAGDRVCTGTSAVEMVEFMDHFQRDDWTNYAPPGHALQIPPAFGSIELVTPQTVAAAHRLGKEIHVWTINDAAEIERLMALGVDGIMSDLPGLISEAVKRLRST